MTQPGLIEAVNAAAQLQNKDLRLERFSALTAASDQPVVIELKRSKQLIQVTAGQTKLAAVLAAGVDALYDCGVGNCGNCAVKLLDGVPDHRDSVLTQAEKERSGLMCICVSRARSERLVLDL